MKNLNRTIPFTVIMLTLTGTFIRIGAVPGYAQQQKSVYEVPKADGSHDFDFEIGHWRTELRRLQNPLSGSTTWVEYTGTTIVRKVWDGRANLVELDVTGPSGHIEALSLRLYNKITQQWSLNFSGSGSGVISQPAIGQFKDGHGEFYDQEYYNGRAILVRFIISGIKADSCHFEQSYSNDGGKTWELNWVATDTRINNP